jgi:hypothetical protein
MKFRKKPVVIEAFQWSGTHFNGAARWLLEAITSNETGYEPAVGEIRHVGDQLRIGTLEGPMLASPGDWIIRGIKGELYACKPDVFALTYESVEPEPEVVTVYAADDNMRITVPEGGPWEIVDYGFDPMVGRPGVKLRRVEA